ncbi:MAG: hypothetical protein IJU00_07265, partial [Selenomonas sp.]|nr:hypothetical protein [Selenomonas sp.]
EISIRQLADIYQAAGKEILGYDGKVIYAVSEDKNYLVNNPQRRCPVVSKAKNILGYAPAIDVEEGVRRFLRFLKECREEDRP